MINNIFERNINITGNGVKIFLQFQKGYNFVTYFSVKIPECDLS